MRRFARFFLGENDFAARSGDTVTRENRFCLILVNLHRGSVFRSTLKQFDLRDCETVSASVRILSVRNIEVYPEGGNGARTRKTALQYEAKLQR